MILDGYMEHLTVKATPCSISKTLLLGTMWLWILLLFAGVCSEKAFAEICPPVPGQESWTSNFTKGLLNVRAKDGWNATGGIYDTSVVIPTKSWIFEWRKCHGVTPNGCDINDPTFDTLRILIDDTGQRASVRLETDPVRAFSPPVYVKYGGKYLGKYDFTYLIFYDYHFYGCIVVPGTIP